MNPVQALLSSSFKPHFNSLPSMSKFASGPSPSNYLTKILYALIRHECYVPSHLPSHPPWWAFKVADLVQAVKSSFDGLEVACWPLVPKFAG